ncbi:hypothetical protein JCM33374_g3111 [Metschnikowia sp. JCM 33374]|nr:hypothetical protein JCM33374_g3111 [Metschnikowia sp. JCM 33374]
MTENPLHSYKAHLDCVQEVLNSSSDKFTPIGMEDTITNTLNLSDRSYNLPERDTWILDSFKTYPDSQPHENKSRNCIYLEGSSKPIGISPWNQINEEHSSYYANQYPVFHHVGIIDREASLSHRPLPAKCSFSNLAEGQQYIDSKSQNQISISTGTDSHDVSSNTPRKLVEKHQVRKNSASIPLERGKFPKPKTENTSPMVDNSLNENMAVGISKYKEIKISEGSFSKFPVFLRGINARNFRIMLVDFLREFHHEVSLRNLFNLLYIDRHPGSGSNSDLKLHQVEKDQARESKNMGLQICERIIEQIRGPKFEKGVSSFSVGRSLMSLINFHEFFRTFLALKIIFACIKKAGDFSSSDRNLPKISVYKAYYILCQRLIREKSSITSSVNESIILGQSKFGQLSKLVHPTLVLKRLGSRGKSKFHYMDTIWNTSIVDEDVLKLVDLDLPHLRDYFSNVSKNIIPTRNSNSPKSTLLETQKGFVSIHERQSWINIHVSLGKPLHTFCDISHKYPLEYCPPRCWDETPNQVPNMSQWAKDAMNGSLKVLNTQNVHLDHLIEAFNRGSCFDEKEVNFCETFFQAMTVLRDASAKKEMYMHLYLVILLMIFPMIVSSDKEVPPASKVQFRSSMNTFIHTLEAEAATVQPFDEDILGTFITILRMMIRVNELTSCKVKPQSKDRILREMIHDLEVAGNASMGGYSSRSPLEETFINSFVLSMHAYKFKPIDMNSMTGDIDTINNVCALARTIKNSVIMAKTSMLMLEDKSIHKDTQTSQDVSYQVFKTAITIFHEHILADPLIRKLPMSSITFMICNMMKTMQYTSFNAFGERDRDLSKEIFKAWWIVSSLLHEYMNIVSEVVALSETLRRSGC